MSQGQPFIWKSSLNGPVIWVGRSLRIFKAGQTVLAKLIVSDKAPACQLCGFMGGKFRKGTMASAHLDTRQFSFSQNAIGAFHATILVLELRENESE